MLNVFGESPTSRGRGNGGRVSHEPPPAVWKDSLWMYSDFYNAPSTLPRGGCCGWHAVKPLPDGVSYQGAQLPYRARFLWT